MKPIKATLKTSFNYGPIERRLKKGTELLILGKWENTGSRSGITYLVFHPEKKLFMRLDSGHLDTKEKVKLEFPKNSYQQGERKKEIDGTTVVHFTPQLVLPANVKATFGTYKEKDWVVAAVIESADYPSGAGYVLLNMDRMLGEDPIIVDSLDVTLVQIGNVAKL